MRKRILIVGSLNMDIVVDMKQMPKTGETVMGKHLPIFQVGKEQTRLVPQGDLADLLRC